MKVIYRDKCVTVLASDEPRVEVKSMKTFDQSRIEQLERQVAVLVAQVAELKGERK